MKSEEKDLICRVDNLSDAMKRRFEPFFRDLWRICFCDTVLYEDFYFDNVYPYNSVYCIPQKGMLHLNPYLTNIVGFNYPVHFIVGVATDERYRRQGVMCRLMQKALFDMYKNKEPFTYLMPADEAYYKPFDFVRVSRKEEIIYNIVSCEQKQDDMNDFVYLSYREINEKEDCDKQALFRAVDSWLAKQYQVYEVHNAAYFELLLKEKVCQNGDVVFCFNKTRNQNLFLGFFAYVMDGARPCVEQIVCRPDLEKQLQCERTMDDNNSQVEMRMILEKYFREKLAIDECCRDGVVVRVISSYPYMIRIVCLEMFLKLFAERLLDYLGDADGIVVRDNMIPENNGFYCVTYDKESTDVLRYDEVQTDEKYISMTVSQITDIVFGAEKNIFFAEII